MSKSPISDQWTGCYPSNWKGVIVDEAMAHPAKFSSKLIRRIYAHLVDEGWVKEGDSVLDPFGGVALGAFDALRLGLSWYGVELEERFHRIGNLNIEAWDKAYEDMPKWGRAKLLHGDSRKLLEVLDFENWVTVQGRAPGITCQVSSPPYAEMDLNYKSNGIKVEGKEKYERPYMVGQKDDYGRSDGQLGAMSANHFQAAISSPPFLQSDGGTPEPKTGGVIDRAMYARHAAGNHKADGYGRTDGQLHHMRGDGFEMAISSPPFAQQVEGGGIANALKGKGNYKLTPKSAGRNQGYQEQGYTEGQLANMKGDFEAAVSSPPYEETTVTETRQFKSRRNPNNPAAKDLRNDGGDAYGETEGQLGTESGDDFWLAAREIVEQVYLALADGGHAVWVVKDYVKNKQVVPFCDQWRQLCEAVGFVTLHEHHAMLVHGRQMTLDGGVHVKESKSFFRRIAEKNGSPRIDYEVVLCMVKADGRPRTVDG